jgi:Uncharacterized conserved protein
MFSKRAAIAGAVMLAASMTIMDSCSSPSRTAERTASAQPAPNAGAASASEAPLPGMPALLDPRNIYAASRPGELSPTVAQFPTRIYVPNSGSNSVDVIDPVSFKIVEHFAVGRQPQHITPSYDLKRLWVLADLGDSATEIDPATSKKGKTIWVKDPYNMYYTPDGQFAVVVAEREARLNFLNPSTMKLVESVKVPCRGIDHMDFSANGRFLIASCEFAASLVKVDVSTHQPVGTLALEPGGMPQDVRSAPDGKLFYVADMMANGVYVVDPYTFSRVEFIATGKARMGSRSAATPN